MSKLNYLNYRVNYFKILQHLEDSPGSIEVNEVEEVICRGCVKKLDFVVLYADDMYKEPEDKNITCVKKWLEALIPKKPLRDYSLFFNSYDWRKRLFKCTSCMVYCVFTIYYS